jgi:homoserine dehydrogenase
MKTVNIILMGFGNVGQAFIRVAHEKKEFCKARYKLDIKFYSIFEIGGAIYSSQALNTSEILEKYSSLTMFRKNPLWKPDLKLTSVLDSIKPGVLVECTPSNIKSGEPGLRHIRHALDRGWHVVTASKGPLVMDFRGLHEKAEKKHVALKFSGATAAALPALDIALYSLAGAEISRIEGILNGTTNYILTRMKEGVDYKEALKEAQSKGIAETDPSLDVSGQDTASKILIISNALLKADFTLDDMTIEGIDAIPPYFLTQGRKKDRKLKLLGILFKRAEELRLEVRLTVIDSSHPLFGVDGTNKGIVFTTDTMDSITVTGGKSAPKGAGASLLKDIINIYRKE